MKKPLFNMIAYTVDAKYCSSNILQILWYIIKELYLDSFTFTTDQLPARVRDLLDIQFFLKMLNDSVELGLIIEGDEYSFWDDR